MFDDMSSAFENETFPYLTSGSNLRLHLIAFLVLIPIFILAAYRGPIPFSLDGAMGLWGAALIIHALWTFLHSGLYDPRREDAVERMMDREMRSTSLTSHDETLMTKVLDYDVRKSAKPLQALLVVASVTSFSSLAIWFVSEIMPPQGGPDYVGYAQFAYIGLVLAVGFYYRNELFLSALKRGFVKSKRLVQHHNSASNESKLKHKNDLEIADTSLNSVYELALEEDIKRKLSR